MVVAGHLHGGKNGKRFGKKLSIVAIDAEKVRIKLKHRKNNLTNGNEHH